MRHHCRGPGRRIAGRLSVRRSQRFSALAFGRPEAAAAPNCLWVAAGDSADLQVANSRLVYQPTAVYVGEQPSAASLVKLCGISDSVGRRGIGRGNGTGRKKAGWPSRQLLEVVTALVSDFPGISQYVRFSSKKRSSRGFAATR